MSTSQLLIDSSVWIDHFEIKDISVTDLLKLPNICCHPYIVGEVAIGNLGNRNEVLETMKGLPTVEVARQDFVLKFVRQRKLYGKGIGFVDCHLLASTQITPNTLLWTSDKRLKRMASELGVAYLPNGYDRL